MSRLITWPLLLTLLSLFVSILLFYHTFSQIKQLFEKNIEADKVPLKGGGFKPIFSVKIYFFCRDVGAMSLQLVY